jgi:hypothetical protein
MSIDEFYITLMNEEIDGIISDADAEKLLLYLGENPEAAKYFSELKETVGRIEETAEVESPNGIRDLIMESVYGRSRKGPVIQAAGQRSNWRSFVPVFAAGAAAGFILFAALRPLTDRAPGSSDYIGTIGASDVEHGSIERFDAEGIAGSVSPSYESGSIALAVTIDTDSEADLLLKFGEGISFESIHSSEGAAIQMEADETSLLVVHRGSAEYKIRLRAIEGASVEMRIFAKSAAVFAQKYTSGQK